MWTSQTPRQPPPVGHITTCPPQTTVNPLECAIVDTGVDFHVLKRTYGGDRQDDDRIVPVYRVFVCKAQDRVTIT